MSIPSVVIVGRPNVGKSSLFNRILRKRQAVVADREGVTRDAHYAEVEFKGKVFELVDTGGFLKEGDPFSGFVKDRIDFCIRRATVIVFVTDGRVGITGLDEEFSKWVLKSHENLVLAVNKMEKDSDNQYEFWNLAMGEPMAISAAQGLGIESLMDKVISYFSKSYIKPSKPSDFSIAILGKPNSGKSTFINKLLGEDKLIVSPISGTTRDAIDTIIQYQDYTITLTDTAGLRKKAKVDDSVEYYSNLRTIEAIRRSDVCALLLDSLDGMSFQDLKIFNLIQQANKGLILCLNKWDLIEKETNTLKEYSKLIEAKVPDFAFYPKISISGLTGQRVYKVLDEAILVRKRMQSILGREQVIEYFKNAIETHPHPHCNKGAVILERCCQVTVDPPALSFEVKRHKLVFESYIRYLKRKLYNSFDLQGSPVILYFRPNMDLRTDEDLLEFLKSNQHIQ